MIELVVEDYCQNCAGFDPVARRETIYSSIDMNDSGTTTTTVECKYKKRCSSMYRHICNYMKQPESQKGDI